MYNPKSWHFILLLFLCHTYVEVVAESDDHGTQMTKLIPQDMSGSFPRMGWTSLKFGRSLSKDYASPVLPCHGEGFYSHPYDCNKFYRCIEEYGTDYHTPLTFTCAPGTVFSEELGSCVSGSCSPDGIPVYGQPTVKLSTDYLETEDLSLALRNDNANMFLTNPNIRLRSAMNIDQKLHNMCEGNENRFFCLDCKTLVLCMERLPQIIPCGYGNTCHDDTTSFRGGVCHPESPAECTCNNEDIFRPDKYDPSKFLTCGAKGAEPIIQSCPQGLEFDEEFSLCGEPIDTTCSKSGTFAIQSDCTKYQTCTFTSTGSFFKSVFTCEGNTMYNEELGRCEDPCDWYNGEFTCKKEGRFPNPGDCSAFYECIKDPSNNDKFIKIEHECQEGYEWVPLVNAYHCVAKGTTKEKCVPKKPNTCDVPKEWCEGKTDPATTIAPTTEVLTTTPTTTTTTTTPLDLDAIDFNTIGGEAHATSASPSADPKGAFLHTNIWHAVASQGLPQSIWYVFPAPQVVRRFSFKSREHRMHEGRSLAVSDGPTKYHFFGSNAPDCTDESKHVILFEDLSGTPFTEKNEPKVGDIANPTAFRCYGFKVFDSFGRTRGPKYCTMSHINFYINKP